MAVGKVAWWVWCGPGARHSRVVGDALEHPDGRSEVECLWWLLCRVRCGPGGEGCRGLTFYLAYFFPVKLQVCNAGASCSNPNFVSCKILFVYLVTVNILNSISRLVVNIIVLCKDPSGLVTELTNKNKDEL